MKRSWRTPSTRSVPRRGKAKRRSDPSRGGEGGLAGGGIVGRGRNAREARADPTAHAEVLALQEAARSLGRWRLSGATVYATLEPCPMCAGALVNARVDRLVYAVPDPKAGAAGTLFDIVRDSRLYHRVEVTSGVLAAECGAVLTEFFRSRRK